MTDENGRGALGSGGGGTSGRPPEERFDDSAILDSSESETDTDPTGTIDEAVESLDDAEPEADPDYARESADIDIGESDAVRADDIDWLAVWGMAGLPIDATISTTQALLALEVSEQTGIRGGSQALETLHQARDSYLVGREVGSAVVEWQLAPHLVEGGHS